MTNISDKNIRKELIDRYLNADTTPTEEKALAKYYLRNNDVDSDERAFAALVRMEHANASLLSNEGAEEYDRLVNKTKGNTTAQDGTRTNSSIQAFPWRWVTWAGGIAASIALLLALHTQPQESDMMDLTHSLQQLINLSQDEDATITATPIGENVWVEATFANGTKKTFIMSRDKAMKTTSFMAIN